MKKQLPAWLALCIIALAAGLLLALTNALTVGPIEEQTLLQADMARKNVLPEGAEFTALTEENAEIAVYEGQKDGDTKGYTALVKAKGYGGEIEVTVGVNMEGIVTGINVGGPKFQETAGLGAKSKDLDFTEKFRDLEAPVKLGEGVDAITGATITTNAVIGAVNTAADTIKGEYLGLETAGGSAPIWWPTEEGKIVQVAAQGFAAEIEVQVGIREDGSIFSVAVGGPNFAETDGLGAKAKESAFTDQFLDKSGKIESMDAISGATITSDAVLLAINTALEFAAGDMGEPTEGAAQPEESATGSAATADPTPESTSAIGIIGSEDGPTLVIVPGFGGPIQALIQATADGSVDSLQFGGDDFAETENLGAKIRDTEFTSQFIGKTGPFILGENIDGISGATISSQAAVDAVNIALGFGELAQQEEDLSEVEPSPAPPAADDMQIYSTKVHDNTIEVRVKIADDGTVEAIEAVGAPFAENEESDRKEEEQAFLSQFIGKKDLFVLDGNIDGVTGATLSSQAIIDLVNSALGHIEEGPELYTDVSETEIEELLSVEGFYTDASSPETTYAIVSAQGFGGPFYVGVGYTADLSIEKLVIGGKDFAETENLGAKIRDEEFTSQFIGKQAPFVLGENIDGISGATISSQAVVDALNFVLGSGETAETEALASGSPSWIKPSDDGVKRCAIAWEVPETLPEDIISYYDSNERAIIATSEQGLKGPVKVWTYINKEDCSISAVFISRVDLQETPGLGDKILEKEFTDQFLGKSGELVLNQDIDAISGATVSSEAVVRAVNRALAFAATLVQ